MSRRRKCASCGRKIDGIEATVWVGPDRFDFCHNDERSCYALEPSVPARPSVDEVRVADREDTDYWQHTDGGVV